jgi:hypothetical protein
MSRRLRAAVPSRPTGHLVERNWPDVSSLDREVVGEIAHVADERAQSPEALRARLYATSAGTGEDFR